MVLAEMGESNGSVSVDVERISFGGKVGVLFFLVVSFGGFFLAD